MGCPRQWMRFGPDAAEKRQKRAHLKDVDRDGDLDLLLYFRTQKTGIAPGDTEASVDGRRRTLQPGSPTADKSFMGLRLVALALTTILGLGCFVFDELDAAEDLMDKPGFSDKQQQQKKPDPLPQSEAAPEKGRADRPSVGDWWKKTRSLTSGEVSDEIVRCELGGATQFMRRPNCLARGGTPRPAGG